MYIGKPSFSYVLLIANHLGLHHLLLLQPSLILFITLNKEHSVSFNMTTGSMYVPSLSRSFLPEDGFVDFLTSRSGFRRSARGWAVAPTVVRGD